MEPEKYDLPMPPEPSDDEKRLITELKKGVPGALEKLFYRYWRPVMRLCLTRLKNSAEAEDAAIETFTDVAQGIKKFRGESKLSTWIYRVCLNRISKHRRQNRRTPLTISLDDCPEAFTPEPETAPREEISRLRDALNRLPEKDQTVLILYYLEELKMAEIGSILGLNPQAVAMRLKRAREKLRHQLQRRQK